MLAAERIAIGSSAIACVETITLRLLRTGMQLSGANVRSSIGIELNGRAALMLSVALLLSLCLQAEHHATHITHEYSVACVQASILEVPVIAVNSTLSGDETIRYFGLATPDAHVPFKNHQLPEARSPPALT